MVRCELKGKLLRYVGEFIWCHARVCVACRPAACYAAVDAAITVTVKAPVAQHTEFPTVRTDVDFVTGIGRSVGMRVTCEDA